MFIASKLWNNLPYDIRMTMNLSTLKMKLKTFLFSQDFTMYMTRFLIFNCIYLFLELSLLILEVYEVQS